MINDLKSINHFLHVSQTKNGVVFDPNKDLWDINDANRRIIFDFKKINLDNIAHKKILFRILKGVLDIT